MADADDLPPSSASAPGATDPKVRLPGEGPWKDDAESRRRPVPRLRGPWWRRPGFIGLAVIVVAVAGIFLFRPAQSSGQVGRRAPGFSGPARPGGEQLSLAAYGGRPVIVNFWASWCGPCKEEMPLFADLAYSGVAVLGVNSRDRQVPAEQFLAQHPVPYKSVVDDSGEIARSYQLETGLPATFAIGADGKIKAFKLGSLNRAELDQMVTDARR